jgi:lipoprotein-anchoring transpeptidase ErfK/SrfK
MSAAWPARPLARLALVSLVAVATGAVSACSVTGSPRSGGVRATGATTTAAPSSAPRSPAAPTPTLFITPADGNAAARPDAGITVSVTGGRIHHVTVQTSGDPVIGDLSQDGRTWQSRWTLGVDEHYTVVATAAGPSGQVVSTSSSFTTLAPRRVLRTQIFEGYQKTYGVGMPIMLAFNHPVTDRAAVERALTLRTSRPVVGAWSWIDDEHLNFRPRDYWPAHTRVSFTGHLDGVRAGPGLYGAAKLTQTFNIGASLIVVASARTHRMHVYRDGRLAHNWPISTGTPGHDTPDGTYLTIEKANPEEMKPSDIRPGQPGYYDLNVPWSVRFTFSGDFLHDAYWSVAQQGSVNVSHGCVNMHPADAEAYYKMARPGDPVTITGSPVAGTPGDGWTDWFLSWSQLLAHSALHKAVSAGPTGSALVDPAAVPASTVAAPIGTASPHNARARRS